MKSVASPQVGRGSRKEAHKYAKDGFKIHTGSYARQMMERKVS